MGLECRLVPKQLLEHLCAVQMAGSIECQRDGSKEKDKDQRAPAQREKELETEFNSQAQP
jgi:hypothetical protein